MKLKTTLAPLLFLAALPLGAISAESEEAIDNSAADNMVTGQLSRDERPGQMGGPGSSQGSSPTGGQGGGSTGRSGGGMDDPSAGMFRELDTNQDGFISKEEARRSADITARFNELDSDRDNRISATEFRKSTQSKY